MIWLVATEPDDRPEKATLFAGDITSNDGEPPSSYASLIAASICASVSALAVPVRSQVSDPSPVPCPMSDGLSPFVSHVISFAVFLGSDADFASFLKSDFSMSRLCSSPLMTLTYAVSLSRPALSTTSSVFDTDAACAAIWCTFDKRVVAVGFTYE